MAARIERMKETGKRGRDGEKRKKERKSGPGKLTKSFVN